ncbi:hypothetical protein F4782DRAFT_544249 [Xylaria castorea]|nr:hypothetical protein F4782DRAFT_544249 [Xylaria castorea]
MMDQHQLYIIQSHPFRANLEPSRTSLNTIVQNPAELDTVNREDLQTIVIALISAILNYLAAPLLPSQAGDSTLRQDLFKLFSAVVSNTVNYGQIKPLLNVVLTHRSDIEIWEQVYNAVTESTPPDELGLMYVDVPNFHKAVFDHIPNLEIASAEIFQKCIDKTPLRFQGEDDRPRTMRRPLAQPDKPLDGSVAKRKLDFAFVDNPTADNTDNNWSYILIPGELKCNSKEDTDSKAWLDLGRYVKEVFTVQPTRRFVLDFTLCVCGRWMRLWEFDWFGAIASSKFDIYKEGQLFVLAILGFLWMDDKSLSFDPTVIQSDLHHQQYIDIERDGTIERLIIDGPIRRTPGVVGRATTCWKAHPKGDKISPLAIKDSWQFLEHEDEGKLLQRLARFSQSHASSTGSKRSSSQVGAPLPPGKRPCSGSASPTKPSILGWPLLEALKGCIKKHKSLYNKASILHRDISINDLIITENDENPSWATFLN